MTTTLIVVLVIILSFADKRNVIVSWLSGLRPPFHWDRIWNMIDNGWQRDSLKEVTNSSSIGHGERSWDLFVCSIIIIVFLFGSCCKTVMQQFVSSNNNMTTNSTNNDMTTNSNYTMTENNPTAASNHGMMAASNNDMKTASNNDMMATIPTTTWQTATTWQLCKHLCST